MSATLPAATPARSARFETFAQLLRSKTFVAGASILLFWIVCAILGSSIAPRDPLAQSADSLKRPSAEHLFGTDTLGRDVLSRVLAGAQSIMTIAPAATLLGIAGGTAIGLVAGYFGGLVDDIVGRLIDATLALPVIVFAVVVLVALGQSTWTLIALIGVIFALLVSRTVRAAVLAERELDYVQVARLGGERTPYIMLIEILPNIMGPIVVEATVRLGYAIFAVAGLTFLGFGVQPPSPDWSLQIADNYTLLTSGTYWWTVLFPALAIASLVVALNFVADGIAQVIDR